MTVKPNELLERIISGGQTGADRGGLEAALALGIPVGGTCPRGRRAEDGRVPDRYPLKEHDSPEYAPRTLSNVLAADTTIVFYQAHLELGSGLTVHRAAEHKKPCCPLRVDGVEDSTLAFAQLRPFLLRIRELVGRPFVLNVAGNRESRAPGIEARTKSIIVTAVQGFLL